MDDTKIVRVGILGAGNIVETLHLPVLKTLTGVRIKWICDADPGRARNVARSFSIPEYHAKLESCSDVDVALIAIPVGYRRPYIEEMARRKWHTICEKPFAATLEDHDFFVAQAIRSNIQIGVGLMRRYYSNTRTAARLLQARAFGPVLEVFASEGGPLRGTGRDESWYQCDRRASGGGVLIETGSHLIDQVCTVLKVESIQRRQYQCAEAPDDLEQHVRIEADLTPEDGTVIPARFRLSRTRTVPNGIWIRCLHATVGFGVSPGASVSVFAPDGKRLAVMAPTQGAQNSYQAFQLEWLDFLRQRTTGARTDLDTGRSRVTLELIEACYRQPASSPLELLVR